MCRQTAASWAIGSAFLSLFSESLCISVCFSHAILLILSCSYCNWKIWEEYSLRAVFVTKLQYDLIVVFWILSLFSLQNKIRNSTTHFFFWSTPPPPHFVSLFRSHYTSILPTLSNESVHMTLLCLQNNILYTSTLFFGWSTTPPLFSFPLSHSLCASILPALNNEIHDITLGLDINMITNIHTH